jgi:hypothetical protein
MMKNHLGHAAALGAIGFASLLTMTACATVNAGARPLETALIGAAEKPNPGDSDGGGTASVRADAAKAEVCYDLAVTNIAPATMAHIHKAPADAAGPPVVTLTPPTAGSSSGCVAVDATLVKDIIANPAAYYVNVHNAEFKAGAVRGQLSK